MDEVRFKQLISGQKTGCVATVLRVLLRTLSCLYGLAVFIRNAARDSSIVKSRRVPVPIISIGNITTGGTGKTPVTGYVVEMLQTHGYRPGIISRGYRADSSGMNDEYRVLKLLCPDVPHEQDRDRTAAAHRVIEKASVDCIVMDDGFQHRRLYRDIDVVLLDALNPFGYGFLLPRGLLREPVSSLGRAHIILITRADSVSGARLQEIEQQILRRTSGLQDRIFKVAFRATMLSDIRGNKFDIRDAAGKRAFLMCGVGNPAAFAETCRAVGITVVDSQYFPDHHHYSDQDLSTVRARFVKSGSDLLLTTQKDLVKLPLSAVEFLAVELTVDFIPGDRADSFASLIRTAFTAQ